MNFAHSLYEHFRVSTYSTRMVTLYVAMHEKIIERAKRAHSLFRDFRYIWYIIMLAYFAFHARVFSPYIPRKFY